MEKSRPNSLLHGILMQPMAFCDIISPWLHSLTNIIIKQPPVCRRAWTDKCAAAHTPPETSGTLALPSCPRTRTHILSPTKCRISTERFSTVPVHVNGATLNSSFPRMRLTPSPRPLGRFDFLVRPSAERTDPPITAVSSFFSRSLLPSPAVIPPANRPNKQQLICSTTRFPAAPSSPPP